MHQMLLFMIISHQILHVACLQILRIDNTSLIPITPTNFTTLLNADCHQCICAALANHSAALNCFGNDTCQLFANIPLRYRFQPVAQAKLYFPTGSLPNASQCCMPDLNVLLAKLNNATKISVSQPGPQCLVVDDHGYLVTIKDWGPNMTRFIPQNLTVVDRKGVSQSNSKTIAFYGNAYYIGTESNIIEVVDSTSLSTVKVITDSRIGHARDIIFLRDGQTMVVASNNNQKLVFFNRSSSSSVNYTYSYQVSTSYVGPHGLWYVNDSFFYVTSWDVNSVYSYATTNGVTWNETLFANVNSVGGGGGATHVTVDECGRKWVSLVTSTMVIYDGNGTYLANFVYHQLESSMPCLWIIM